MRHLFIDDGELTRVERLYRRVHQPRKHPANPVLDADTRWESLISVYGTTLYDEERGEFRRWYLTSPGSNEDRVSVGPAGGSARTIPGNVTLLGYATSTDGVHWRKPDLGQLAIDGDSHNNLLRIGRLNCEGASIIEDPADPDPDRRFKAFYWEHGGEGTLTKLPGGRVLFGTGEGDGMWISHSPDGVRWTDYDVNPAIGLGSDTDQTVLRDPALDRYVAFGRFGAGGRKMARSESEDFVHWSEPRLVFECDAGDEPETQFYGVPIDLYEGLYLGMPWIYREGVDGTIDTQLAVSRDGIRWQRVGARETFLPLGAPGSPEDGMARVGKRFIVRGDHVYLFYGAVQGPHGGRKFSGAGTRARGLCLALLRRDGFVSMSADGDGGRLLTRPVTVAADGGADALRLNLNAARGRAVVALCDDDAAPIDGFEASRPVSGDHTDTAVTWPGRRVGELAGRRVRLRVDLHDADLFSFWFG